MLCWLAPLCVVGFGMSMCVVFDVHFVCVGT